MREILELQKHINDNINLGMDIGIPVFTNGAGPHEESCGLSVNSAAERSASEPPAPTPSFRDVATMLGMASLFVVLICAFVAAMIEAYFKAPLIYIEAQHLLAWTKDLL